MSVHRVVYKGLSDIREMSVKDLKQAGVSAEKDMVWNKITHGPQPAVYVADISDRLLEIFRAEGTFTVTEIDEQTMQEQGGSPILVGAALDDTGDIVRDSTTGQTTQKGDPDNNADPVLTASGAGATGSASGSDGEGEPSVSTASSKGRTGKGRSTSGS